VLESLTAGYVDPLVGAGFSSVVPYLLLLGVLFVRPHGIFGRPEARRI
jgi:branched-chain amino acid transport system permease protein